MSDLDRITPPEKRVKLLDGREIIIKMWAWPLAHKLAPVVARMFQRPAAQRGDAETVILESMNDGVLLLKETLGWTDDDTTR